MLVGSSKKAREEWGVTTLRKFASSSHPPFLSPLRTPPLDFQCTVLKRILRFFASVPNFTIFRNATIFRFKEARLTNFTFFAIFRFRRTRFTNFTFLAIFCLRYGGSKNLALLAIFRKPRRFFALCCDFHSLLSC